MHDQIISSVVIYAGANRKSEVGNSRTYRVPRLSVCRSKGYVELWSLPATPASCCQRTANQGWRKINPVVRANLFTEGIGGPIEQYRERTGLLGVTGLRSRDAAVMRLAAQDIITVANLLTCRAVYQFRYEYRRATRTVWQRLVMRK